LLRTRNVTEAGREISLSRATMSAGARRFRNMYDERLFERIGSEYRLMPRCGFGVERLGSSSAFRYCAPWQVLLARD
jgi:hypothetical protein